MAIPGAGELNQAAPEMNTQAKKPAFEPKGDVMPIPMQPAPVQEPRSIREYLTALKAGQTPMFTNDPNSPMAQDPNAMVFGEIGQGPGGPVTPPGAIAEEPAGDPADQHVQGTDSLDMAKQRLEQIMPDIKEQFDGQFGNSLSLDEYNEKWPAFVQHTNKNLIKHYDAVLKERRKNATKWLEKNTGVSVNKYLKSGNIEDLRQKIDVPKITNDAQEQYMKWQEEAGADGSEFTPEGQFAQSQLALYPDVNSYVMNQMEMMQKAMDDVLAAQTAKDAQARGGAVAEPGAQGAVPPELAPEIKAVEDFTRKMMQNKRPDGTPITKEEVADLVMKFAKDNYPKTVPFL